MMAAMQLGVLCPEFRGDSWGGERCSLLLLLAVLVDVVVVVVLKKLQILKDGGGTRSSEVRTLFEGDPTRPGHPLCVETENKLGDCVLKIRCRICRSLIPYHNSSWTCAATHIRSHNIATAQDIAAAAPLPSESEANGEAFPAHKLPTSPLVMKEAAGDAALM